MTQYIDKSALVAEIEKWMTLLTKEKNQEGATKIDKLSLGGRIAELQEVKVFIDTLEVKEVDLEKEYENYVVDDPIFGKFITNDTMGMELAKYFFELGLVSQLTWKDVRLIAEIGESFMNSQESDTLNEEEYYTEILNRFKAQKGE